MNAADRWFEQDRRSYLVWALLSLGTILGASLGWFAAVFVTVLSCPPMWTFALMWRRHDA